MGQGDVLRGIAESVDVDEGQIVELEGKVGALTQTLSETQTTLDELVVHHETVHHPISEPPPPPPPPPPTGGGIEVLLTENINDAINKNPAGKLFTLEPGDRTLKVPLVTKKGNELFCPTLTMFVGPGAGSAPFLVANDSATGMTLSGIGAKYYGPANSDQGAGMIDFQGGTNLTFERGDFGYSNKSVISGHKSWDMLHTYVHHGGKYSVQGAFGLIQDCEWSHSGRKDIAGVAPWTASNDKGGSKFVLSKGCRVIRLLTHDHGWTGIWFDIQNEDVYLEDVISRDNARHGISIEVSYGPVTIIRPVVQRCGTEAAKKSGETNIPVPAGILISMSPNVTVLNPEVEDCYNGIIVRQWNHPQVLGTVGNADASRLGVQNISIEGGFVKNSKQFDAGVHGSQQAKALQTKNIHYKGVEFDSDAKFCGPRDIN